MIVFLLVSVVLRPRFACSERDRRLGEGDVEKAKKSIHVGWVESREGMIK